MKRQRNQSLVSHANNDDCVDESELSTKCYTHDELIKITKRKSRVQRTLFKVYREDSRYLPLPKPEDSMSQTLRRAKGGIHDSYELFGYTYVSMPSNGWNCWVYALRLMAMEWDLTLCDMMRTYYPHIPYEEGKGLLVPDRYVANTKLEAHLMPEGFIVMHDHAFIKLKTQSLQQLDLTIIVKLYMNFVADDYIMTHAGDDIIIHGIKYTNWVVGLVRAYSRREYADSWNQPGFMNVEKHPRQVRNLTHAMCSDPRIEYTILNIHSIAVPVEVPYIRQTADTVTFYPSSHGQCLWECIGFYYLWSQYEWNHDFTSLLDYVVVKEVAGATYKRYVKRSSPFGQYNEILVDGPMLNEFQTKHANLIKNIQLNFGTSVNTIAHIQTHLSRIGLELTTKRVKNPTRPILEVYYSVPVSDLRTVTQLMADSTVPLHARLHIPAEYVKDHVTIQFCRPLKFGSLPTQYCAETALDSYGAGYKDTVKVRRWFNGSTDTQTDLDDIMAHLDTQPLSNTTIVSTNDRNIHTIHHSDVMFMGTNTSRTLILHLHVSSYHWMNLDMKDLLAWCDPKYEPKHGTSHVLIDGYKHTPAKVNVNIYTPVPPTLINEHIPILHDFMKKYQLGYIVIDVPRLTQLLPINTTGRACVARVNIEYKEVVFEYEGMTDTWPLTDFHYQMAQGYSTRLGYIKLKNTQHLGSGVYISQYVETTKCDLRLTVQASKSKHSSSVQADTSAMFDSQLKVFELSVLSDTVRRRAIIAGDPTAIDQACNFCYAVTSSKDANYCEAQLIDAIRILALQREERITGFQYEDPTIKKLTYLTNAWEGNDSVRRREQVTGGTNRYYVQRATYHVLKYGFNSLCSIFAAMCAFRKTVNISRYPSIWYAFKTYTPSCTILGRKIFSFNLSVATPQLQMTDISKTIPKGKLISFASRRNPDSGILDYLRTLWRGHSLYEDVCKAKYVDYTNPRKWIKNGIRLIIAGATMIITYKLLTKLRDRCTAFIPDVITHPELIMHDYTKDLRIQHGCPVCQGIHLQCRYCDFVDRDQKPRASKVVSYRGLQQFGLFAYLHGFNHLNNAVTVVRNSKSSTHACIGIALIFCTFSTMVLKPWLFQNIRGGVYEPQTQARANFRRFPKVMDDTLTKEMTDKTTMQNCTSYSLPGFQSVDHMIEEIRTMPIKEYEMKNTTSLEPLFQDIRLNCIDANTKAALTAVFCRQLRYDIKPDPKFLDKIPFMQINLPLLLEATMTAELPPFAKYAEQFPLSRRLKYIKGWVKFLAVCGPLKNSYNIFGKMWEMIQTTKRGRIICGPDSDTIGPASYLGWLCIIIRKLYWALFMEKDDIFKNVPYARKQMPFIHGCNSTEIRLRLETCFRTFKKLRLITLDIKGFDGSQSRNLLRLDVAFHLAMFRVMCARIGLSHHHTEEALRHATTLDATLKLYIRRGESHYKIKRQTDRVLAAVFKAHQSVFSGNSYLTTLGNTDRQLHTVFALFQYGGMMEVAWAFASGDDMLIAIEDEYYDKFRELLNECYAPDGTTGVYGSGMILKEILTSYTSVKFLSKKVEVFGSGIDTVVEFYRDIPRFVQTGGSGKKLPISNAMINYMNTCQLKSQCYGDKAMLAHIAYRERTMPHQIASRDAWSVYYNDSETIAKGNIHITTDIRDLSKCATRDPSYALMKAQAKTHEIILIAEGGQSLPPVC